MTQSATGEPAFAVPGEDALYEIIDGVPVELPPMGTNATLIASILQTALGSFVASGKLGIVVTEALFVINQAEERGGRSRRPDVAYVSSARWPSGKEILDDDSWNVIPDLAVEVISRTDRYLDSLGKLREYFEAGVQRVWHIIPPQRQVYVYESLSRVTILDETAELNGDPILPGFRMPVSQLFPNPPAPR